MILICIDFWPIFKPVTTIFLFAKVITFSLKYGNFYQFFSLRIFLSHIWYIVQNLNEFYFFLLHKNHFKGYP